MTSEQLWAQFTAAVLSNNSRTAYDVAATLKGRLDAGDEPPRNMPRPTWGDWIAAHPEVITVPGAITARSTDPSLLGLSDYLVIHQDEGDGISVLIPR